MRCVADSGTLTKTVLSTQLNSTKRAIRGRCTTVKVASPNYWITTDFITNFPSESKARQIFKNPWAPHFGDVTGKNTLFTHSDQLSGFCATLWLVGTETSLIKWRPGYQCAVQCCQRPDSWSYSCVKRDGSEALTLRSPWKSSSSSAAKWKPPLLQHLPALTTTDRTHSYWPMTSERPTSATNHHGSVKVTPVDCCSALCIIWLDRPAASYRANALSLASANYPKPALALCLQHE